VSAPIVVVIAGLTGIVSLRVAVALLLDTDVAVTVTVSALLTVAGAVYVAADAVILDSTPHAEPVQPVPLIDQVTPCAEESPLTEADRLRASPASTLVEDG
jgi:hypothetical protein